MTSSRHTSAVVALFGSCLLFTVMGSLVKVAKDSYNLDSFKMGVFRFAIGMGILGVAAMTRRIELRFVSSGSLLVRGVLGGLGVVGLFLSISYLGVARGTVVSYSFPVFAAIGSMVILREKVTLLKWVSIAAAFAGIVLIAMDRVEGQSILVGGQWVWYVVALAGAACAGLAIVYVRKLSATDSPYAIFFAQCVMGLWLTVVPANLHPVTLDLAGGALLVAIGVVAAVAQLLLTYAYTHITVATGGVISNLVPVLSAVVGLTFFNEPMSSRGLLGTAIVIGSCGLVALKRPPGRS